MPHSTDPAALARPFVHETLDTRALHFSVGQIQSRMLIGQPDSLDLDYTRTMMGFLLFNGTPRRIAMIGLGGGSMAKFCHRHLPAAHLTVVEINRQVIELRDAFGVPPDGPRLAVVCADGARFVRETEQRFEVLLIDGFDADGLPPRLCSQAFYDDCLDVLQPAGLLVANLHADHPDYPRQLERLRRSFGAGLLVVDPGDGSNSIVFARKGGDLVLPAGAAPRRPSGLRHEGWPVLRGSFAQLLADRSLR
jgi:spermidine synthase